MFWLRLAAALAADDPLRVCEAQLAAAGDPGTRCFYDTARATGAYDAAIARLGPLCDAHPDWASCRATLANLLTDTGEVAAALPLYEEAIRLYDASGDLRGRVFTRLNLASYLPPSRLADQLRRLDEATVVAGADPALSQAARAQRARLLVAADVRLGDARDELLALLEQPLAYQTELVALNTLRLVAQRTGDDAGQGLWSARVAERAAREGDRYVEATAALQVLDLGLQRGLDDASVAGARAEAARVGALAREGGNPYAEVEALCLGAWLGDWPDSQGAWGDCLAAGDELGDPVSSVHHRVWMAGVAAAADPALAEAKLAEADSLVQGSGLADGALLLASARLRVAAARGDREAVASEARRLMAEASRQALGPEVATELSVDAVGEELLSVAAAWALPDPELALVLSETRRGAVLARQLRDAGTFQAFEDRARRRRELEAEVVERIEASWEADEAGRADLLEQIAVRSAELYALDRADWAALPSWREPIPVPTFAELSGLLDEQEALVLFQFPSGGGPVSRLPGAFAWVVTRSGVQTVALPAAAALAPGFEGLADAIEARDGAEQALADRLGEALLAPLVAVVPAGVTRWTVVPDGPMHAVPLGALRVGGAWLEERVELAQAPSVTAFARWRSSPAGPPGDAAVFTSPLAPDRPPLPGGRLEAEAARAAFGGRLRRSEGSEVTPENVASALADPGLGYVHLAAHAENDPVHSGRSALWLSPGADGDPRLEAGELARLGIPGQVVVLSACRSAGGVVAPGEGPIGLTRSLVQAGASAVVGSVWPLRDDEAAALFSDLLDRLGRGEELGSAVAGARRARLAAGAPVGAWAGVVLVGDARRVVAVPSPSPWGPLVAGAALLGVGVVSALRRMRRSGAAARPGGGR